MFVDTSGFFSAFDANDPRREAAVSLLETGRDLFTTSYVLSEFIALGQARRHPRKDVLDAYSAICLNPAIQIVWVSEALHRRAFALLEARMDKQYLLCDAVSFVLMRERGDYDALTTDHHFGQEGFRRLLPQNV